MIQVMAILVIRLQFPLPSPPLLFNRVTTHITICTVTCRHACNMMMIEAVLSATSLSLCCTVTCYGIDECLGSCWCMGDSKYKDSTIHIQAKRTQIQWRRPSLGCCFNEDYNIMAFRICINRFWLGDGKAIILVGFPRLHMYSWCQSSAVDGNYHTDKGLYSFLEISMCTNITKYTVRVLDRHPSEKCSELIHPICPTSMISYQSQ